ncbi:hypothetical protein H5410_022211 [Solanum commersonii]|uniref:Uncharacterized protein n=1 Tax=Solanum commersonii TaxID=4109 RepID=A0A9J5ZE55_SOLCO|nr:hypothetical protein H5410_022211 [Solanum commersonii]
MNEVNNMFIDTLKVKLKSVTFLTSSIEVVDDDQDLNHHNHITGQRMLMIMLVLLNRKSYMTLLMIEICMSVFL